MNHRLALLICRLRGHVPYYVNGEEFAPRHYGPGFRYCGRCQTVLEGWAPELGDRKRIDP